MARKSTKVESKEMEEERDAIQQEDQLVNVEFAPWDSVRGATAQLEIARRQADRKGIAKRMAETPPPAVFDMESIKEHAKRCRELHEEYSAACYLVDYDIDRYKRAFEIACMPELRDDIFAQADAEVPLSTRDREQLEIQRAREEQAKIDAEKRSLKNGDDLPGQQKLKVKDDGFCAEAASDVEITTIEE